MRHLLRVVMVGGLAPLSVIGCGGDQAEYCDQSPTPSDCPAPDGPPGCTADEQCPGQVCDIPSRTCVQCTASSAAACTDATPVCDTDDHTCRACAAHSECASNACLPDGTCAAEDQVAYVTTNGQSTDCTHAAPCSKIADALATQRPYVKVTGTLTEAVTIDNQDVTVLADSGAKLTPMSQGSLLTVSGTSNVSVYDLDLDGAHATGATPIVQIQPGATGTVSFTRGKIDKGGADGILSSASGGTLTVTQSTVSGNTGAGISASGGTLTVTQSTVSGNTGGGIAVTNGATFDITNNFIYRNGNPSTSTVGGVLLDGTPTGSTFSFNTIADNYIKSSTTYSAGVSCDLAGFSVDGNLIVHNQIDGDANHANANTRGQCSFAASMQASSNTDFAFRSPSTEPYDYHLTAGSTAVDQATVASNVSVDFDGEPRPNGAQKDQGADEYTP